tara:strand:+ start:124 stop:318 length:195 start_codon:yes stop_codon:yes gene_type:complete
MKKLMNWVKSYALSYATDYLKNNKDEVIAKLNKKIDVKFLNEKQEKALLEATYDVVLEVFEDKK